LTGTEKSITWSNPMPVQNTVPPVEEKGGIPVKLSYGAFNVFMRYYNGQSDPLYAVLSRRGSSVDFVTVFATPEEVNRLKEVAHEIIKTSPRKTDINTAQTV
jgi:hypothetical protein